MSESEPVRASIVVLGYGAEPYLRDCLTALTDQLDPDDEVVLVDHGIDAADRLDDLGRVRRIGDGTNRGFAGGCSYAAEHSRSQVLVFVNSDAIAAPGSVEILVRRALEVDGIVGGCLRLADRPDLVNSVGNPLHYLGITWAGHCGEPASLHTERGPVAVATGGFLALRRSVWDDLGGFFESYFAYQEDTDLSLRCWLGGRRVEFEPAAVALHHYEFSRSPRKLYLIERNRWQMILADYPARLLVAVVPPLLVVEPALLLQAVRQGWARQKLAAAAWVLTHLPMLLARRRRVQAGAAVPAGRIAALMTDRIEPPMVEAPAGMGVLNAALAAYWKLARRRLLRPPAAMLRGPGARRSVPGSG